MSVPPGSTDNVNKPAKALLKRIDIGLTTGIIAVFVAFMSLLVARAQTKMALEIQKASVLPIIDIDMGYLKKPDLKGVPKQHFEVTLNNVGAGIAHIQSVTPMIKGEPVTEYQVFEDAVMTRRMRSWTTLTESPAAGYLRAGENITPVSYRMGSAEGELSAYLRGEWGIPFQDLDVTVCYCSVFEDCWIVNYVDRKTPKPVDTCGITDAPIDAFQSYTDQRIAARQANN